MHCLHVSFFHHARDNRPVRRNLPWSALLATLQRFRPMSGGDEAKRRAPCWSPANYVPGTTRAIANVIEVSALVLDFDSGLPMDEALVPWAGHELLLYTSWRHKPEHPKYRLVLPLAAPVAGAQWTALYLDILAQQAPQADRKCQDPSRIFFLPAVGAGGPHQVLHQAGAFLDLADRAELTSARHALEEQAARRPAQREAAIYRHRPPRREDSAQREDRARHLLSTDPGAREQIGLRLGGRCVQRARGPVIEGVACPQCGRPSVWWPLSPSSVRSALCEHRNTCGWMGSLFDLALQAA